MYYTPHYPVYTVLYVCAVYHIPVWYTCSVTYAYTLCITRIDCKKKMCAHGSKKMCAHGSKKMCAHGSKKNVRDFGLNGAS